jgi:beta-glucosidase
MRSLSRYFLVVAVVAVTASAEAAPNAWDDARLTPDQRATLVVQQMTEAEKLSLVRGWYGISYRPNIPPQFQGNKDFHDVIGSAGYEPGIPHLGLPSLQESDASLGVANAMGQVRPGDVATALPSGVSLAAGFDPDTAYQSGAMIASEAWHKGLNVLLGPGLNLMRDPRNGRTFEYLSEDPLLSGVLAGQFARGIQDQHVVATLKHYALNDQETNRQFTNVIIDESAMRESDLLAFELALETGNPGAVMCSYNLVNGTYACSNGHLLNDILKDDWHFKGWVMSDWGGVHSTSDALAGLDQESGVHNGSDSYFGSALEKALANGTIPPARLTDMAERIVRSMFAAGLVDHPATKSAIDYNADGEVALHEAENGIVLLKNEDRVLPLSSNAAHIAVIGGHADAGVLSGGGSSQVYPVGGPAPLVPIGGSDNPVMAAMSAMVFDPSPPLAAIRKLAPKADVRFDTGMYPSQAAKLAKWADVVIVFATQWEWEGTDVPDISLPQGQEQLIEAVAAQNSHIIVVLETGGPVTMPWLDHVSAVVEAWYPGQRGGDAIADVLFGNVNPSGHLPITFPKSLSQYPPMVSGAETPKSAAAPAPVKSPISNVAYTEGSAVGYRWFAQKKQSPLFPFGFGLSYTDFECSNLQVDGGHALSVSFDIANTGSVAGATVPQVYLTERDGEPLKRLIGFSRVMLNPGEKRRITLPVDPRLLADFDATAHGWRVPAGDYDIAVGLSSEDEEISGSAAIEASTLPP